MRVNRHGIGDLRHTNIDKGTLDNSVPGVVAHDARGALVLLPTEASARGEVDENFAGARHLD